MKTISLETNERMYMSNKQLLLSYNKNKDIDIRNKIIINNLGLIYMAARKRIHLTTSFTFDDLVQEGVIGMMKGIDKFDLSKNISFSTYAYYWISQQMDRAIMNGGYIVRLPAYIYEKINKLSAAENDLLNEKEEIDIKQLCKKLNISEIEYHSINNYKKNYGSITSLNTLANPDSDESYNELLDYIPCNNNPPIDKTIIDEDLKTQLRKTLNSLTLKEREILELRFGLNDNKPMTLEAIGKKYNVTRERIRQIENKALKKLSRLNSNNGVKDFLIES